MELPELEIIPRKHGTSTYPTLVLPATAARERVAGNVHDGVAGNNKVIIACLTCITVEQVGNTPSGPRKFHPHIQKYSLCGQ
jgi:hypothetical protein